MLIDSLHSAVVMMFGMRIYWGRAKVDPAMPDSELWEEIVSAYTESEGTTRRSSGRTTGIGTISRATCYNEIKRSVKFALRGVDKERD